MPQTIFDPEKLEAAADKELAKVKAETPSQFRVGGTWNGKTATGGISYDRKWSNLWGVTAYAKAYWNDQPIVPTDKFGYVIGADVVKKFGPKP